MSTPAFSRDDHVRRKRDGAEGTVLRVHEDGTLDVSLHVNIDDLDRANDAPVLLAPEELELVKSASAYAAKAEFDHVLQVQFERAKEAGEQLANALAQYTQRELLRGDLNAARWLLLSRHVVTEPLTETMYAFDKTKGHYVRAGEALLRADFVRTFGSIATRARIGEVLAKVSALSYRDYADLQATTPPNLLPFANGILDVDTGILRPHSPEHFFTYVHPVAYDPSATCPQVLDFLKSIVEAPGHELLVDIAALALARERLTRHFFILVGQGHNGKSKYIELARALIGGERCVSVTPQHLSENDFAPSLLYDKHANLGADIPGGKIYDASVIKSVTGGDPLTVQKKGKDHFDIQPYCELVYSSNDPPRFAENTYALWDRLVVITFPYTFVAKERMTDSAHRLEDKDIEKKILAPNELSGFLNLVLARLKEIRVRRALTIEPQPADTKRAYDRITNTPATFLQEMCEEAQYIPTERDMQAEGFETRSALYTAYKAYCVEKKLKVESAKMFGRRIFDAQGWSIEEGRDTVQGERVLTYRGVRLREPSPSPSVVAPMAPISSYVRDTIAEEIPAAPAEQRELSNLAVLALLREKHPSPLAIEDITAAFGATTPERVALVDGALKVLAFTGDVEESRAGYWRALS